jgi:hypothetical protein
MMTAEMEADVSGSLSATEEATSTKRGRTHDAGGKTTTKRKRKGNKE